MLQVFEYNVQASPPFSVRSSRVFLIVVVIFLGRGSNERDARYAADYGSTIKPSACFHSHKRPEYRQWFFWLMPHVLQLGEKSTVSTCEHHSYGTSHEQEF